MACEDDNGFPAGIKLSAGVRAWALSDLEAFEARRRGVAPPPPRSAEDERYLRPRKTADRLDITMPTLWRWHARAVEREAERASAA